MLVVVEGRRPNCWSCSVLRHMAKVCRAKHPQPATRSTATAVVAANVVERVAEKDPDVAWEEVRSGRRVKNVPSLTPQKECHYSKNSNHHHSSR